MYVDTWDGRMSKKDLKESRDELRSDIVDWLRRSESPSSRRERSEDGVVRDGGDVENLEGMSEKEVGRMFGEVEDDVRDLVS